MVVEGGMGTVTQRLAAAALEAGAKIHTGAPVASIEVEGAAATGVVLRDGQHVAAKAVVVNADPFRLQALVGAQKLPAAFNAKMDTWKKDGTTMKVGIKEMFEPVCDACALLWSPMRTALCCAP